MTGDLLTVIAFVVITLLTVELYTQKSTIEDLENRIEILENESINDMRINYEKHNGKYKI